LSAASVNPDHLPQIGEHLVGGEDAMGGGADQRLIDAVRRAST
jgi:hypothetical protein